ncbi:Non-specific lipid-transfer protein 12 [Ananas comosus]|uniref:Non-specific lipid-transfer protein n=1 Tax=Ananas comosus TaxID=4615 RepID=A0A199VSG0_ANACO|nr:Non-specific lipid-transfer protein 12 [Ananas comosus]
MKSTSIAGILLLMMLWNVYMATEGVRVMSCGDVSLNLGTCMYYLAGIEPRPPFSCCDGVRHLKSLAVSTADRRLACHCMRVAVDRYTGLRNDLFKTLPDVCCASLSFSVDLEKCDE